MGGCIWVHWWDTTHFLLPFPESLNLDAFEEGQNTENSLCSEEEDPNEQLQNVSESFVKKQSLTCHVCVKWNSAPAKCLQNMGEGLRKRQWTRKLRENLQYVSRKLIWCERPTRASKPVWAPRTPAKKQLGTVAKALLKAPWDSTGRARGFLTLLH